MLKKVSIFNDFFIIVYFWRFYKNVWKGKEPRKVSSSNWVENCSLSTQCTFFSDNLSQQRESLFHCVIRSWCKSFHHVVYISLENLFCIRNCLKRCFWKFQIGLWIQHILITYNRTGFLRGFIRFSKSKTINLFNT